MAEAWLFLKDAFRRPRQMGAIAPSGRELADLMVAEVDVRPEHVVVELGAGTGTITRAIRDRAPNGALLAFEPGPDLAKVLRERYPGVEVSERLAHELPEVLAAWKDGKVDRVVSGLPWTIWPREEQARILEGVVRSMQPDGRFVTFTYVHSQVLPGAGDLKNLLSAYFERVTKTRVAWMNVPPAFAYVAEGPRLPS